MLKAKHYVCVKGDMFRPGTIIDLALSAEEEARLIAKGAAEVAEEMPEEEPEEKPEAQIAPAKVAEEEAAKEPEKAEEEAEEAGEFELKIDAAEAVGKRKGRRGK